jgi:hypothetical protein
MQVQIKKRSRFQRFLRLNKMIKANWKFASNCNLINRIIFTWNMVKIVMK